jgi:hypothetical protein
MLQLKVYIPQGSKVLLEGKIDGKYWQLDFLKKLKVLHNVFKKLNRKIITILYSFYLSIFLSESYLPSFSFTSQLLSIYINRK